MTKLYQRNQKYCTLNTIINSSKNIDATRNLFVLRLEMACYFKTPTRAHVCKNLKNLGHRLSINWIPNARWYLQIECDIFRITSIDIWNAHFNFSVGKNMPNVHFTAVMCNFCSPTTFEDDLRLQNDRNGEPQAATSSPFTRGMSTYIRLPTNHHKIIYFNKVHEAIII